MRLLALALIPIFSLATPIDGLIHSVEIDRVEWYNLGHNAYIVQHTNDLREPWSDVALEVKSYVHNNPEGFYRVIRDDNTIAFPVWNSGTTSMDWIASTDCSWIEFEQEMGFDIPPDGGEDFLILRMVNAPSTWEIAVITISAGDCGGELNQSMQVTVELNEIFE